MITKIILAASITINLILFILWISACYLSNRLNIENKKLKEQKGKLVLKLQEIVERIKSDKSIHLAGYRLSGSYYDKKGHLN